MPVYVLIIMRPTSVYGRLTFCIKLGLLSIFSHFKYEILCQFDVIGSLFLSRQKESLVVKELQTNHATTGMPVHHVNN